MITMRDFILHGSCYVSTIIHDIAGFCCSTSAKISNDTTNLSLYNIILSKVAIIIIPYLSQFNVFFYKFYVSASGRCILKSYDVTCQNNPSTSRRV